MIPTPFFCGGGVVIKVASAGEGPSTPPPDYQICDIIIGSGSFCIDKALKELPKCYLF